MDERKILFQGEVLLLAWAESHSRGATISLQLADPSQLEAFKLMTVAKGKMAGQRLAVVMVEIGDDEQPVTQKGGELSKLAGIWCADPQFQRWLGMPDEAAAAARVRDQCGIASRAELDHNHEAKEVFDRVFRVPYRHHLSNGG